MSDRSFHTSLPHCVEDLSLEHVGDEHGYRIPNGSDTQHEKYDRKVLSRSGQGFYLAETHGRNCDEGHVQTVLDGPAFDQPVACGPYHNQENQEKDGGQEPYEGRESAHRRENKNMDEL